MMKPQTAETGIAVTAGHTINEVMIGRSLVAGNAVKAVELALELAGGAGFYRSNGLERCLTPLAVLVRPPLSNGADYAGFRRWRRSRREGQIIPQ